MGQHNRRGRTWTDLDGRTGTDGLGRVAGLPDGLVDKHQDGRCATLPMQSIRFRSGKMHHLSMAVECQAAPALAGCILRTCDVVRRVERRGESLHGTTASRRSHGSMAAWQQHGMAAWSGSMEWQHGIMAAWNQGLGLHCFVLMYMDSGSNYMHRVEYSSGTRAVWSGYCQLEASPCGDRGTRSCQPESLVRISSRRNRVQNLIFPRL